MKIGITGQAGFVGTYLYHYLGLEPDTFERVPFEDSFFSDMLALRRFVKQCDVIVHLAAMNRNESEQVIYDTNIRLVQSLIEAMESEDVTPHVFFSSSTQETKDNLYGRSKFIGRKMFEDWAARYGASFSGLVVPNVYGEFSRPNYNTFIATFAHKLVCGEQPTIVVDSDVRLIYVGSLCKFIISQFAEKGIRKIEVPWDFEKKVSEILTLFENYKCTYFEQGCIPALRDCNEVNLFNTFRSYMEPRCVKLVPHVDIRGTFVETMKLGVGGQVSLSTTARGVTRGNHYHTRKIERFVVIKGHAVIELRKIGDNRVYSFEVDGSEPSYVDMPVWYTHNIRNVGKEDLYTQFWINEWYNPADGDTYFETV
ncbi:MAG: NAD-dependent epimerase/dehydratase family protein [Mucinivorans sp.]